MSKRSFLARVVTAAGYSHESAEELVQQALDEHAHELAEKIRADTTVMAEAGDQYALAYANLIEPQKEGQ